MPAGIPLSQLPWDQRLARVLVSPFAHTALHPNHLTTLSLLLGVCAASLFAAYGMVHADVAAIIYMLAVFTDHTDGELARLAGKTSKFGHDFDFVVGGINYTLLFIGIGVGLGDDLGAAWPPLLGLAAGLSNPFILYMRMRLDRVHGKEAVRHPGFPGFELEDFIYFIGPITWVFGLTYFFVPYGLGTLCYLTWTALQYRRWNRAG